jgi:deoxycytidine triphosphate deaminase
MKYRGIILTGTSGSGKSTLAHTLCTTGMNFSHVKAVTTRTRRHSDHQNEYDYISEAEFIVLKDNGELFIDTEYRGNLYGIRLSDIAAVENTNNIPILVLSPVSAKSKSVDFRNCRGRGIYQSTFLTVFVDAPDDALNHRLGIRERIDQVAPATLLQRNIDRQNKYDFIYTIEHHDLDTSVELLIALWMNGDVGGVISARLLRLMLGCGALLSDAKPENIAGASYDLSLGDEYFYGGLIHYLSDKEPFLQIEPYDYAIVTSREMANLPSDVVGRFDLSVSLFCQGVILSCGPQVDPGFRGKLFCLLFNTSSSPVLLKRGQHYTTIEFNKLLEPTLPYKGRYQNKILIDYLPTNATRGAINELKKELEEVRAVNRQLQGNTIAILSLVLAIAAVLIALA